MDNRKLMHYQHQHGAKHYLGYHEGDHMDPVKLATFEKGISDSAAYELVERFNKYPDLLSQRDELAAVVRKALPYIPNEGDEDMDLREAIKSILSKLSQL